ncbi:MAG: glycoside hydrolase family 31 protein [Tidjanibacter sp.]|nr:glycoside hydrolase family 31 protein [Tidjanibacter sp.]
MKKYLFWLTMALSLSTLSVESKECTGYRQLSPREYRFADDAGGEMMLRICSESVLKVWYSFDGGFKDEGISIAVVEENLDNSVPYFAEQPSSYELFTDKMRVVVSKSPMRLEVFDKYQKLLFADCGEGHSHNGAEVVSTKMLRPDEHIYGLGEKAGTLDRRGRKWLMWNSDKPCYCTTEDPLYKSVPFFMSSLGYGVLFDNTYKSSFDFGSTASDCYTFSVPGGELKYYLMVGSDYKELIGSYIALTGRPVMPPRWALGFSQCRGLYTNEKLALDVAATFRQKQIPCDVIYQDIGWTEHLQDFEWRKANYSSPRAMIDSLHRNGFRVVVSQDPVVSVANASQWGEADKLGFFTVDRRTGKSYDMTWPWGGNCGVVDFTNPAACSWWGACQQKAIDDGVDGFWTDMGEPAWSNEESTDRLFQQHSIGSHDAVHNVYGLYWDKAVTEQFEERNPNKRLFQMTRSAFAGMQRYAFSWTGDSGSATAMRDSWEQFAAQIPMMLSAGMGGIPFITGDITGYCGEIDDYAEVAELYVRWLQFGLFTPLSRAHHEGNTAVEPWQFGLEAEQCARKAIELKYKLLPYIYTTSREAYDTGMPLMRAMILEFPREEECRDLCDQFMFGGDLLVAPVTEQGATSRSVYLPKGLWYDYYSGEQLKGGQRIEVDAPLERIPLYVRAGAIIATSPVEQYWGEKAHKPLYLDCYLSKSQSAQCSTYNDDGLTLDYKRDICSRRTFALSGNTFTLGQRLDNGFAPEQRNIVVRIPVGGRVKNVTADGRKLRKKSGRLDHFVVAPQPYWYCLEGMLYIVVPDDRQAQTLCWQ